MKYIQTLIEYFRNRWNHYYLTELREHQACGWLPNKVIELGDFVLIQSDNSKWVLWKMGEVIELIKGADGVVRAVLLRTSLKNKFCSETLSRPIERLCPLELKFKTRNKTKSKEDIGYENNWIKERYVENERPQRAAADTGILNRRMEGQE